MLCFIPPLSASTLFVRPGDMGNRTHLMSCALPLAMSWIVALDPRFAPRRHTAQRLVWGCRKWRACATALLLAALAAPAPWRPRIRSTTPSRKTVTAALATKPMSLPDMALVSAKGFGDITEYASMTCAHRAAFEENVFPMPK